jgi:hypothetical protein
MGLETSQYSATVRISVTILNVARITVVAWGSVVVKALRY